MAKHTHSSLTFQHFISLLLAIVISIVPVSAIISKKGSCTLFNLGDSNTDSGAFCAAFGLPLDPPYGHRFPNHDTATCRSSDGRLYLDFLCESLGLNYLSPYMKSLGSDFSNGANFAVSSATAYDKNTTHPFPLSVQVKQFAYFQKLTSKLMQKGKGPQISEDEFKNAVFSVDIGQNDLANSAFVILSNYQEVVNKKIPNFLDSIENATKRLHERGARKFLIYNTGPMGCLPSLIPANTGSSVHLQLDTAGCVSIYNDAARVFNEGLRTLTVKLRSEMKNTTIVYVDMFTIKYDLVKSSAKYGFENSLKACCEMCMFPEQRTVCPDSSHRVSWDGVHYSEAANAIVASKIFSGEHSSPNIKLKDLCNLVVH